MTLINAKKVGHFRRVLEAKVRNYSGLVQHLTNEMANDVEYEKTHGQLTFAHQVYWLSWHAVTLPVAAVAANEAAQILNTLKGVDDEAAVPEVIKSHAMEHVFKEMKISDRSTSASANLVEDAKRAFWSEIAEILLKAH